MTYTVSSGMLNPSIPYHTIPIQDRIVYNTQTRYYYDTNTNTSVPTLNIIIGSTLFVLQNKSCRLSIIKTKSL